MSVSVNPMMRGLHRDISDRRDLYFYPVDAAPVPAQLPRHVDLTPGFAPVYDQENLGSCGPNAGAAAFEYDLKRQNLPDMMPSRLFLYYYARPLSLRMVDSGTTIRDVIKTLARYGVCPEPEWPYDISKFTEQPSANCITDALKDRAVLYRRVPQTLLNLKSCLAQGLPIVFGISVYQSFLDATDGVIPMPMTKANDRALGEGHALVLCGYDEDQQVFLFRNSWSSTWGGAGVWNHPGYGTIPYGYLISQDASDFWVVTSVMEADHPLSQQRAEEQSRPVPLAAERSQHATMRG